MCLNASPFLGMDQLSQFPNLQQWLGLAVAGNVELGHIVDPPVVRTATAIVPLGWTGVPGEKNGEPLKVDIAGYGLHLCTLVQARVNGNWYCFFLYHSSIFLFYFNILLSLHSTIRYFSCSIQGISVEQWISQAGYKCISIEKEKKIYNNVLLATWIEVKSE